METSVTYILFFICLVASASVIPWRFVRKTIISIPDARRAQIRAFIGLNKFQLLFAIPAITAIFILFGFSLVKNPSWISSFATITVYQVSFNILGF